MLPWIGACIDIDILWKMPLRGKAVSSSDNTIRQTEEKLRKHGRHGFWITVIT